MQAHATSQHVRAGSLRCESVRNEQTISILQASASRHCGNRSRATLHIRCACCDIKTMTIHLAIAERKR